MRCREIARVAYETNRTVENIGARRLHTVIERIVEEVSFDAPEKVRMERQPLGLRVRARYLASSSHTAAATCDCDCDCDCSTRLVPHGMVWQAGEDVEISEEYVKKRVGDLLKVGDLRKYIL